MNKNSILIVLLVLVALTVAGTIYANSSKEEGIITEVDYSIDQIQPHWDDYKTVIVDENKLEQALKNGSVDLNLLGEKVEITITESKNTPHNYYRGYANGVHATEVEFYFGDNTCSCYVELGTHFYQIAPTGEMESNEMIYVLYMTNYEKERQRHEDYPIDPLTFEISNEDNVKHNISIEIFDPSDVSIFNKNYSISPDEIIASPEISETLGKHRYIVMIDNNYRFEQFARVERAAELGSSEKLYFNLINNSEYPVEVAIEMA